MAARKCSSALGEASARPEPPGLWLVDAATTTSLDFHRRAVVAIIPAGQTVGDLLADSEKQIEAALAILRQLSREPDLREDGYSEVIAGAVMLIEQAKNMQVAAHQALGESAVSIGQH